MPTPLKLLILEDNAFDAELEVAKLQAAGYQAFLVGEYLVSSKDRTARVKELLS